VSEVFGILEVWISEKRSSSISNVAALPNPFGYLVVASDERGTRPPGHGRGRTGPQVRPDEQPVPVAAMQFEIAALPFGSDTAQLALVLRDGLAVEPCDESVGRGPGLVGGVAADHMQSNAAAHPPPVLGRPILHAGQLLGDLSGRFAPGEEHIRLRSRDVDSGVGRPTQIHCRERHRPVTTEAVADGQSTA